MTTLTDRNIIVTGASGGVGRAAAFTFARAGATVALIDRDANGIRETSEAISRAGGNSHVIIADITEEAAVAAAVAEVVSRFGKLHGAFNNAGVEQSNFPLHEIAAEAWAQIISIDLTGVFYCMKHQISAMLKTGGGAIVNTASALRSAVINSVSDYIAAKHGVIGLTKAAAVDYGALNIRVNAILPSAIETPMIVRASMEPAFASQLVALKARHPIGRLGKPDEVAEVALWLLSDAASFVTGSAIFVDDGYLAI